MAQATLLAAVSDFREVGDRMEWPVFFVDTVYEFSF